MSNVLTLVMNGGGQDLLTTGGYMEHLFQVSCKGKTKLISCTGSNLYAKGYISGFVQAMRDSGVGKLVKISVHQLQGDITKQLPD